MYDPTMDDSRPRSRCTRCGAKVPGGTKGCRELFQEILVREYGDPAYGAVHLLTVDAYALQHSEDHGPRSNAVHLLRLCMLLEHGLEASTGTNPHWFQVQIESDREMPFLEPPQNRGQTTVADMHGAANADEYVERAYHWARSVWEAYRAHHGWARRWLQER